MSEYNKDVFLSKIEEYDAEKIKAELKRSFDALGIDIASYKGKRVVVKPNLVMKKSPESAATTHPAVLDSLLSIFDEHGISPVIAESPGGVYSASRLGGVYRACGIEAVAKKHGAALNYDVSHREMAYAGGKTTKKFEVITPIADADVIFDLCKLKSHSLTVMSGAVKNFYGVVPGIIKFEMHAAYPDVKDFSSMICDLASFMCEKEIIAVTDAIIGMEGEGPTGGEPVKIGSLLVSKSPFSSDVVSAHILGIDPMSVPIIRESVSRGYVPGSASEISVIGDLEGAAVKSFKLSSSHKKTALGFFSNGRMGKLFMPRPFVTSKCRGCGECASSCPAHTISIEGGKAKIKPDACIRCYCCQELCPFVAIKVRRNLLINAITKIK